VSELQVAVAGCPFIIAPAEALSPEERRALRRLGSDHDGGRAFRIRIEDGAPQVQPHAPVDGEPAEIRVDGDRVLVIHQRLTSEIDPFRYEAVVHRGAGAETFAIEVAMRTALGCRLPLESGVLLHSAGIVVKGRAYVFYGVSGAGKSTLASFMTNVLSDELVAIRDGFGRATGFWGTLDAADAPSGAYPLAATIELARGAGVSIDRLAARNARRALLLATVVPPHPRLWTAALRVVERLSTFPAFRLAWTPSAANAKRVVELLP